MRTSLAVLKMMTYCLFAVLGAVVLLTILPVVVMLLMAGPLLAMAGLTVGLPLLGTAAAIIFIGPSTAMGGGLAVSAAVRDFTG